MYATVSFKPVVATDAVVVPAQAVIRSGERDVVVIALGKGRFAPREVTLGAQTNGLLQVLEGLDAGARVVRAGHQKLFEGAPVMPVTSQGAPAGAETGDDAEAETGTPTEDAAP